jgi:hypothetical protein
MCKKKKERKMKRQEEGKEITQAMTTLFGREEILGGYGC